MDKIRIGINGLGRIGRMVVRLTERHPNVEIAALNATVSTDYLAYLLQYDTMHGIYHAEIEHDKHNIYINGRQIPVTMERDPVQLLWGDLGAEYVIESTGRFLTRELAGPHIAVGAKKVVMSAPAKDDTPMFVCGVNLEKYTSDMTFVSNASCTTNCLAPLAKVLNDSFGIEKGLMSTIHSITASQMTVDGTSRKDWRGGRAAGGNIIPSSTGAARAVGQVLPELAGRLTGLSIRVPTLDVSLVDMTAKLKKHASYDEVCAVMRQAAVGALGGIMRYVDKPLVSSDFLGDTNICIFDAATGMMLDDDFVKLIAWYDNEMGYSDKLLCLIEHMYSVDHPGA